MLGGAGGGSQWFLRQIGKTRFRIQIRIPCSVNIMTHIRDVYVDWMLSAAGKTPVAISRSDAWSKRIPKSGPAKTSSIAFECRLMFEITTRSLSRERLKSK
ncbi:hypothetical protein ZIOFF_069204 [Zingiber officinale]|uniref:Uncharacterized protein n=1 Tax=Zingiber officinale TaxID=94328 RepID=A0A8J5ERI6_ZINOF|nr:hypothetical protein ZIOFF_069204 [Zingiber officinale]